MVFLRCKVLVLGDASVGKTALVQSFISNGSSFPKNYVMTQCAAITQKVVDIEGTDSNVELNIFDIAGQSIYKDQVPNMMGQASAVMLVYDITNDESFNSMEYWLRIAKEKCRDAPIIGVVVAAKIDQSDLAVIGSEEGEEYAAGQGFQYFNTSANRGQGLDDPFVHIANTYYEQYEQQVARLQ